MIKIDKSSSLKIYILEYDKEILQLLENFFKNKGTTIRCFRSCKEVLDDISSFDPDIFIVDPYPEGKAGLTLCAKIRANPSYNSLPVLVLSSRISEKDKVDAFSAGVDDYLTKPFMFGELEARIFALLRRSKKENGTEILETRTIRMNRNTRTVSRNGRNVPLGPLEFKLLEYFILNKGRVLSRAQLLEKIWVQDESVIDRTVDVYVLRLRKALISESEKNPIKTIRSLGYLFDDDTEEFV